MKLSENTINLLKNFAGINPNIVFKPGSSIATIAEAKNIMASATIAESFPQGFGIYDLNEFLSTLALVENAELTFNEDSVLINSGAISIQYFYSSENVLTSPSKAVSMPNPEVTFVLSQNTLDKLRKASAVLGYSNLEIMGANGKIVINLSDAKNPSANKYSIVVDGSNECKNSFSFVVVIGNLKMISGDYTIQISSKLISHLKHTTLPVEYYVALEKTSSFAS